MNSYQDVLKKIWVSKTVNHWLLVSYTNACFSGMPLSLSVQLFLTI